MEIRDLYLLLVVLLIRVAGSVPSARLKRLLATAIGSAAYYCSANKRRLSEEHISRALAGEVTEEQISQIVKEAFCQFWREAFSLLPCHAEKAALASAQVHGIERLHRALADGNGVILWECSSFGKRTLAKQILCEKGFLLHQIHAEHHLGGFGRGDRPSSWVGGHIIEPRFDAWEKRFVSDIIYLPRSESLTFTRTLLGRLNDNGILCVAGDGKFGHKLVRVEFLGQTDRFATGMVSLAKLSGAPILPMFCVRDCNGETSLTIEIPIRPDKPGDRMQSLNDSVTRYASLLESYIRNNPDQYWGWHRLGKFPEHDEMTLAKVAQGLERDSL